VSISGLGVRGAGVRFLLHHEELPMKYVLMYTNRPDLDAAVPEFVKVIGASRS
jgi:hypothetical protein